MYHRNGGNTQDKTGSSIVAIPSNRWTSAALRLLEDWSYLFLFCLSTCVLYNSSTASVRNMLFLMTTNVFQLQASRIWVYGKNQILFSPSPQTSRGTDGQGQQLSLRTRNVSDRNPEKRNEKQNTSDCFCTPARSRLPEELFVWFHGVRQKHNSSF